MKPFFRNHFLSLMPIACSNGYFESLLFYKYTGTVNVNVNLTEDLVPSCVYDTFGDRRLSYRSVDVIASIPNTGTTSSPLYFPNTVNGTILVFIMSKDTNAHTPRIDSVTSVASTKWLELQTLQWTDYEGKARLWDVATRTTKQRDHAISTADAVVIIPFLRHSPDDIQNTDTLLIRQFRPPVGGMTVEFPAGLIDKGESVEQAALRELREETGYVGEACKTPPLTSRALCMSPGLTDETVHVVLVEVDLNNPYNQGTPKPELDIGEHCLVERVSLQAGLKLLLDQGTAMPLMGLYLFALGYELGVAASFPSNSNLLAATVNTSEARNDDKKIS
jgi:ADP-ribose pyrophosphatase